MKKILCSLLVLISVCANAQLTTHSWSFGGSIREYKMYIPASYNGSTAVPVVFCLHGLGDNMSNFTGIGMNYVADTANFIVITPQALVDPLVSASAWNSGASYLGYTLNGSVNDIGFLGAILDTLIANYNINQKRVYSCGFSMGGFMTNRLGCEMNDRIAAIASVAGTIGGAVNCTPGRAVPSCHFHGTGDSTVYYNGNLYGNDAEALALFWAGNNNCSTTPTITALPDIAADNYTITHKLFSACDDGADVELFRVDSADHVWLTPANDIFYTTEIWKFFMKHEHPDNVSVSEPLVNLEFEVYPNPSQGVLYLLSDNYQDTEVTVMDVLGKTVVKLYPTGPTTTVDLSQFENGSYLIQLSKGSNSEIRKVIIQK